MNSSKRLENKSTHLRSRDKFYPPPKLESELLVTRNRFFLRPSGKFLFPCICVCRLAFQESESNRGTDRKIRDRIKIQWDCKWLEFMHCSPPDGALLRHVSG